MAKQFKMSEYPFRYDATNVGDKVWITIIDDNGNLSVAEDVITQKTDYAEVAKERKDFSGNEEDYLIDYWIETYSPGHAMTFGYGLFRSKEEAEQATRKERAR